MSDYFKKLMGLLIYYNIPFYYNSYLYMINSHKVHGEIGFWEVRYVPNTFCNVFFWDNSSVKAQHLTCDIEECTNKIIEARLGNV